MVLQPKFCHTQSIKLFPISGEACPSCRHIHLSLHLLFTAVHLLGPHNERNANKPLISSCQAEKKEPALEIVPEWLLLLIRIMLLRLWGWCKQSDHRVFALLKRNTNNTLHEYFTTETGCDRTEDLGVLNWRDVCMQHLAK